MSTHPDGPDDLMYPCAECGHMHWTGEEYVVCPVRDCVCGGQKWCACGHTAHNHTALIGGCLGIYDQVCGCRKFESPVASTAR